MVKERASYRNDPIFLYHFGKKLDSAGDYAAADPYLERAAGLDPDSAAIRDEWARALMGHGRVSIAYGILRQFMGSHPHAPDPPLLLGKFYVSREEWAPALRALNQAAKLNPANREVWSLLAHAQIKMGLYGDAQKALQNAIERNPDDPDNHLQLAVLLGDTNRDVAKREFQRAISLAPKNAICIRQYGRFLMQTGDAAGAEREAREAVALAPGDMLSNLLLGQVLVAQHRWADAAGSLEQSARLAPGDPEPAAQLRQVYTQLNQPQSAAQWNARYLALKHAEGERNRLADATQAHPKDPLLHHQFAVALAGVHDVNGCVREEAFAARSAPDNPMALTAAANDLDKAGFSADALPIARTAAQRKLNPNAQEALANILLHLGRLHEAAIHFEQIRDWKAAHIAQYRSELAAAKLAIAHSTAPAERLLRTAESESNLATSESLLARAVELEPENTRCLRALMKVQYARRETEQAIATAGRLCSLSPEDGVAQTCYVAARLDQLGGGALSESDYQDLQRHLKAAELDPSVIPTVVYDHGVLALKHGDVADAIHDLQRARALTPNAPEIYVHLADAQEQAGDHVASRNTLAQLERKRREQAQKEHTP
jgi:tetratricopeptide (TPR) repeat protein